MKHLLFFFLALFLTATLPAQNIEVVYLHVSTHMGQKKAANRTLLLKGDQSVLFQHLSDNDEPPVKQVVNQDGSISYNVNFKSSDEAYTFIDRKAGTITANAPMFGEVFLVKENITPIDWSLTDNTKNIADYTCYEAIGFFRGRTYSAWFTLDIPVSAGPFKFTGLPGLILEISDQDKEFSWHCKSIALLTPEKEQLIREPTKGKELTLPEFYDLVEKIMDRKFKAMETNSDLTVNGDFKLDRQNLLERTN